MERKIQFECQAKLVYSLQSARIGSNNPKRGSRMMSRETRPPPTQTRTRKVNNVERKKLFTVVQSQIKWVLPFQLGTLITYMLISPDSPWVSTGPNTKSSRLIRRENLPFPALQIQEINLHTSEFILTGLPSVGILQTQMISFNYDP